MESATNNTTHVSTIQNEIQELHGHLSDTDSSVGILLNKINELTEFENGMVVEQSDEIGRLRDELDRLQNNQQQKKHHKNTYWEAAPSS